MTTQPTRRDPWTDHAACTGADHEDFYPPNTRGRLGAPARAALEAARDAAITRARTHCQTCPVTGECLTDALTRRDTYGIRAGLLPDQLTALLRQANPPRPGTLLAAAHTWLDTLPPGHTLTRDDLQQATGSRVPGTAKAALRDLARAGRLRKLTPPDSSAKAVYEVTGSTPPAMPTSSSSWQS